MTFDHHLDTGLTYVAVDGISIAVEVVGNGTAPGPVIAWIHGLGSSSIQAFAQVSRQPALTGTTSLLIDLVGHGTSDKPTAWSYTVEDHARVVSQVLAKIVGPPVTLLGHSMGGTIAIACAVSFPGAVERLIVAVPSPGSWIRSVERSHRFPKRRTVCRAGLYRPRASHRTIRRSERCRCPGVPAFTAPGIAGCPAPERAVAGQNPDTIVPRHAGCADDTGGTDHRRSLFCVCAFTGRYLPQGICRAVRRARADGRQSRRLRSGRRDGFRPSRRRHATFLKGTHDDRSFGVAADTHRAMAGSRAFRDQSHD